jgi:hypothetical protein
MKKVKQTNDELQPIEELVDFEKESWEEIADRLWFEYYNPAEPISGSLKKFIMEQHNNVAEKINRRANKVVEVMITSSMLWDNAKKENPTRKKKIYVDCKMYTKDEQPKEKTVVQKIVAEVVKQSNKELKSEKKKINKAVEDSFRKSLGIETTNEPVKPIEVSEGLGKTGTPGETIKHGNKSKTIIDLHIAGKTKEQIIELTGFKRKAIIDAVWRYENPGGKKKTEK